MLRQRNFLVLLLSVLVFGLMAVSPARADEARGRIKSVDKDSARVVVTAEGKDLTLKVKGECKILLDGKKVELEDLSTDQKVTVTYKTEDGEDMAQEIVAESSEE